MSRLRASLLSLLLIVLTAASFFAIGPTNPYWLIALVVLTLLQSPIIFLPLLLKPSSTNIISLGAGASIYFVTCSLLPYFHSRDSGFLYIFSIPGAIIGGFAATHWLTSRNIIDWRKQAAIPVVGVLVGAGAILGAFRAMW
jgi:FtsH-binding integral membrane protein